MLVSSDGTLGNPGKNTFTESEEIWVLELVLILGKFLSFCEAQFPYWENERTGLDVSKLLLTLMFFSSMVFFQT